jgi:hypothetical protein
MALKVSLNPNYSPKYGKDLFNNTKPRFYDHATGVLLTQESPESDDISAYVGVNDSYDIPVLAAIGRAIQTGVLYVSENTPDFPPTLLAEPTAVQAVFGGIVIVPGTGTNDGEFYQVYVSGGVLTTVQYNTSGSVTIGGFDWSQRKLFLT